MLNFEEPECDSEPFLIPKLRLKRKINMTSSIMCRGNEVLKINEVECMVT